MLASENTIKKGLSYFIENRVFALDAQENVLLAQVEGSKPDQPYWVELSRGADDQLVVQCDCADQQPVCKHAIAALYSYAEQASNQDSAGQIGSAMEEAIAERIKKGRNEVKVSLISGNLGFGIWQATSLVSATHWQRSYQVHIRSLDARMNYCTCPDLASNRLGTCKHIEAVLHFAKKRPGYKELKAKGSPLSFVYLAWESATNPQLRLYKTPEAEDVVGVPKKMLETLVDDLAESSSTVKEEVTESPPEAADAVQLIPDVEAAPGTVKQTSITAEDNSRISALIVQLQSAFTPRIQRIMGANGGLLVVLEQCTQEDELLAEALSQADVPVAVIAAQALRSLQRLGISPVSERELLPVVETVAAVNPLIKVATDKLQAAEILMQQHCSAGVLDLLAASMLTATAVLAGQTHTPAPESASVWLYTDILPQQLLTTEQVAAIVRVMALSQSSQVPDHLLEQCLQDARQLIAELGNI